MGDLPPTPSLPGQTKEGPPEIFVLEKWGSLNTKASRTAIPDNDFSYLLNFFPIGDGNLRTLYAEGASVYGVPVGRVIIYQYPFNLGSARYIAVFLDNGAAQQVSLDNGAITDIAGAGTFRVVLTDFVPACAQHGSDNIIIVSKFSANGYWIWNGTSLFTAGTLGFDVGITNGGRNYTSPPTLTAYGGSGSGATFTTEVHNGAVTKATVTNPGSGWKVNEYPVLAFSGGGSDDGAAGIATVTLVGGGISAIIVTATGVHYDSSTLITITGDGTGAQAVVGGNVDGALTSVIVINPGVGYTFANVTASSGSGFAATAVLTPGQITSISVAAGGTNYTIPPVVTIVGDGTGAKAHAVVTAGSVTSFVVDIAGYGYTFAYIVLSGGNAAAQATISLMPFGVSGDTVETYQQRVWVGDGDKYLFTGAESLSNFSASSGGGAVPVTDSFTKYKVVRFIQNNFLYRICDSSVNVISNVQTTGVPATTSFNDENVDPQVGTSWPNTVVAFGRATMFANPTGVYALFGGAAQKVSDQLDGLFANANFNTGTAGITPTAAVFDLFSIKVYGLLFNTIDPYTNQSANIVAIWDGKKWFLGNQVNQLNSISTQELDSKITAYGNTSTNIYPLFQSPSNALTKVAQSKLSQLNSYTWYKQGNRFYVLAQTNDGTLAEFQVGIDTELGAGALTTADNVVGELQFLGSDQQPLVWTGLGGAQIEWTISSIVLYGYRVSIYGRLIGVTTVTTASDATLISETGMYAPKYAPYV